MNAITQNFINGLENLFFVSQVSRKQERKKRTISVPLMFNLTFQNRQQNAKHLQKKSIFPRQFFDTKAWKMLSGLLWRQWSYLFVKRPGGKPGPMRPKILLSCTYHFAIAYLYLFISPRIFFNLLTNDKSNKGLSIYNVGNFSGF